MSEKTRRVFPTTFSELARTGMIPLVATWPAAGQPGRATLCAVPMVSVSAIIAFIMPT